MGLIQGIKNIASHSLGIKTLQAQHDGIKKMTKSIFTVSRSQQNQSETFEEALQRLQLTESDIKTREANFKRLNLFFIGLGIIIIIYLIYLLITHSFFAALGCFGILMIITAQLFRYNFWLFQIRQRRLGCSFKEWFLHLINKKTHH